MPRLIDYPRAAFSKSLEMAEAVDYLGGSCTSASCAEKMGLKISGAFSALIGAAMKHNLIEHKKGILSITEEYKKIKLAYTDEERLSNLRAAFLAPPLYTNVYEKFKRKELPVNMLDKIFIREFSVDEDIAQRVAGYFIDGAEQCGLLINNNLMDRESGSGSSLSEKQSSEERPEKGSEALNYPDTTMSVQAEGGFRVHIIGAGINSTLILAEEDDFLILEAMINKLKKKIKNGSGEGI